MESLRKNKTIGWFKNGQKVICNDGFFIRLESGLVLAWMVDGSLS